LNINKETTMSDCRCTPPLPERCQNCNGAVDLPSGKLAVQLLSDIHIDGYTGSAEDNFNRVYTPSTHQKKSTVLVVAGDVSHFPEQVASFLNHCASLFHTVVFVPGNHEYYKNNYADYRLAGLAANVLWPGSSVKRFYAGGHDFVVGTLWGCALTNEEREALLAYMSDFRVIKNGSSKFTPDDMTKLGLHHRHEIARIASGIDGHKFIVTHHLPSYKLVSPRFAGSPMNAGFVNDCSDYFDIIGPATWLFGHTHDHIDKLMDGIRFVANPYGYPREHGTPENGYKTTMVYP